MGDTMTIPDWNHDGVVPPIWPGTPDDEQDASFNRSPYLTSVVELVGRFAITRRRIQLLDGLLNYRAALHALEIRDGFQWIDGSFLEHVEADTDDPRLPNDIDVFTFYYLPGNADIGHVLLFDTDYTTETFQIDAYGMELGKPLIQTRVENIVYWSGMWWHRRSSGLWKGFVQVDLNPDEDEQARQALNLAIARMG